MSEYELILDAETLSEDSLTAPVVDISAMIVDKDKMISDTPYTMFDIIQVKHFKLDVSEQVNKFNCETSEKTIEFWMNQPKEIRRRVKPHKDDISVDEFVNQFKGYIGSEPRLGKVWTRNLSFDIILLKRLFKFSGKNLDDYIEHYLVRDIRTAIDAGFGFSPNADLNFCPVKDEKFWAKVFEPHNSTWDVMADVLRLQAMLRNDHGLEQINR